MTRALVMTGLLALAACGADGPPVAPSKAGISLTGEASIGIRSGR
jgi:predicted small lipoprotein YifL